jgi:class 3 adenylate cyclase
MSALRTDELVQLARQRGLRLPAPLERQFQNYYFDNYLWINRIGLFVGLVLWSVFGLIDIYAMPESLRTVWVIRFGLGLPVIIGIIVLSFLPVYRRWIRQATALLTLVSGLGILLMIMVAQPVEVGYSYYIFGLMVVLSFLYTVPGPQFIGVLFVSGILLLAQVLIYLGRPGFLQIERTTIETVLVTTFLVTMAIVGIISTYLHELSIRQNFIQRLLIECEQDRSEDLLLNIMPATIAERLKRGDAIADFYPAISILFADIVGFTPLSAGMSPANIVGLLNQVFTRFDELTERFALEKIKTIGDAYMVVSGLPVPRPDHAEVLADLALEMQDSVHELSELIACPLQLRIGLHTGSAVAGVIGWRKFAYDLWGDAVNTASRMESHGLTGKIQVSEEYYKILKGRYCFDDRGEIDIKGKGLMHVYLLQGRLDG